MVDVHPTHTCFDDALDLIELLITANPKDKEDIITNLFVVHAICLTPNGYPYAHAWVEDNKTKECIFRGIVKGEAMYLKAPKAEYYEEFKVQETTMYSVKQAYMENLQSNHYGPWEEKYKVLTRNYKRTA